MKSAYVVTITKRLTRLGEENPMTRIVFPKDIEDFLEAFAGEEDDVKLRFIKVYGE